MQHNASSKGRYNHFATHRELQIVDSLCIRLYMFLQSREARHNMVFFGFSWSLHPIPHSFASAQCWVRTKRKGNDAHPGFPFPLLRYVHSQCFTGAGKWWEQKGYGRVFCISYTADPLFCTGSVFWPCSVVSTCSFSDLTDVHRSRWAHDVWELSCITMCIT